MKFNRYWISGKCGHGHGQWKYFHGNFGGDIEHAREWILCNYEDWARWAERYSMEIELDVKPTLEYVKKEIHDIKMNILNQQYLLRKLYDIEETL